MNLVLIDTNILLFNSTRSCAALQAADLDWIVGPEYSLGGYIFGDHNWPLGKVIIFRLTRGVTTDLLDV